MAGPLDRELGKDGTAVTGLSLPAMPAILMVTGEYPPKHGGVGDYTAILSEHLAKLGARVVVLTDRKSSGEIKPAEPEPAEVIRVSTRWGFDCWPVVSKAAACFGVQIVHIQYQTAAYSLRPAINLLPGYLRVSLRQVKVVTTFHDLRVPYLFPKAGRLRRGAVRALDALSHRSIVTNQADLEALGGHSRVSAAGHPKRLLVPIGSNIDDAPPPDFDRAHWRSRLGVTTDTLLLSYFGFMNDSKGVETLLRALAMLRDRGLDTRLLIVGGEAGETDPANLAYFRRVERSIQSLRLEGHVLWTGFLPPEQVSASLHSSDLCVLPFRDGASLRRGSLLAALVHGLPVVTTCPTHSEPQLVEGENVALVERENPKALAGAIERLWRDPASRHRLAVGARSLARRFSWSEIAASHMGIYRALMS